MVDAGFLTSRAGWRACLTVFVALRVAIPLAALADHGHALPGLPRYEYNSRPGDAYGYYSAVRELLATWRQPVVLLLAVVIVAAAAVAIGVLLRRRLRGWAIVAGAFAAGAIGSVLALRMHPPGAVTIGWPLVWSVPLLPYRALGLPLNSDVAFGVGLALSLLANAVTVVGTAVLGRRVTGRAAVGLGAAGLYASWPLLTGLLAGHRAWENGTWFVDTGLHMYSEPVSTALVVTGLVIAVEQCPSDVMLAFAGILLSFASVVRLTNAVIAAAVLLVAAVRLGVRRSIVLAAALAAFAPVALAYWSKGYTHLPVAGGGLPTHPFALSYVRIAWTDSLLWRPSVLVLLLPLAAIGTLAVTPSWRRWLLWLVIGATAAFYSVYAVTDIHPRFLYVVFPAVLVLWVGGVAVVAKAAGGSRAAPGSSAPT